MSVKELDCNPKFINRLLSAQLNDVKKVLSFSCLELEKRLGLSRGQVEEIVNAASKHVLKDSAFSTIWDVVNKKTSEFQFEKLSTGCSRIDSILGGGILCPGITEIAGESSSGKTQLCLQICINVKAKFPEQGCLYICTEDAFPNKRLDQISSYFCQKSGGVSLDITNGIFIEHAADIDTLVSLLETRLTALLSKQKLKMIVIDSIAAIFRAEYESSELVARAKMLSSIGHLLQRISFSNKISIICVNQVSAVIDQENTSNAVIPALGLTWSYFVKTRLQLARTKFMVSMFKDTQQNTQDDQDSNIRTCSIVFSPHRPSEKCHFIVLKEGICSFEFPS